MAYPWHSVFLIMATERFSHRIQADVDESKAPTSEQKEEQVLRMLYANDIHNIDHAFIRIISQHEEIQIKLKRMEFWSLEQYQIEC